MQVLKQHTFYSEERYETVGRVYFGLPPQFAPLERSGPLGQVSMAHSEPNKGLQPTAYSLRSVALRSGFRQRLRPGVSRYDALVTEERQERTHEPIGNLKARR